MATETTSGSSVDDIFLEKKTSNIKEENTTEETKSVVGESSSCYLSEDEIDSCLDSSHIKNNFTDIQKIGAGGFGSVYQAVHTIEERKYALKFVKIVSLDFDKNEVKILASLDHPNVLKYYTSWMTPYHKRDSCSKGSGKENSDSDVYFENEIPTSQNDTEMVCTDPKSSSGKSSEVVYDAFLVIQTELCNPQKNLKILIDEGEIFRMSYRERLFLDIVSGLQYIHGKSIMHRDLKPSNILIDKDNRAKIGDFGFAKKYKIPLADKISENFSQNVGTYLYVAPEVRNSTVYDKTADIYSLGMILFEMYHRMESGMERIKTMEKLRNQEFGVLKNIPDQFRDIRLLVKSLLNHDPSLRKALKRIILSMSSLDERPNVKKTKSKAEEEKIQFRRASRFHFHKYIWEPTQKCYDVLDMDYSHEVMCHLESNISRSLARIQQIEPLVMWNPYKQ